ncbi:unnamed protein product [Lathyrus oleraceus]
MVKSLKFVYIMIIILFSFIFSINSKPNWRCKITDDCPTNLCELGMKVKCKYGTCRCLTVWNPEKFVTT